MSILPGSSRVAQRNFATRQIEVDDADPRAFQVDFFGGARPDDDRHEPPAPKPSPRRPDGPRTLFDSKRVQRPDQFFIPRRATAKDGTPIAPYRVPGKPEPKPTTKPQEAPVKAQHEPQDAATDVPASVARVCLVEGTWRSEPFRRSADGWRGEQTGKTMSFDTIDRAYRSGKIAIMSAPAAELDLDELLTRKPGVDEPSAEDREWNARHASNQRGYYVVGEYRASWTAQRYTRHEFEHFQRNAPRSAIRAAASGESRGRRRPVGSR